MHPRIQPKRAAPRTKIQPQQKRSQLPSHNVRCIHLTCPPFFPDHLPTRMNPNVALFITCLTDQFYPHVGVAVTKILEHFGCSVVFPREQTCCGQPFFNNGFQDEARELAKRFIRVFEGCEYIVTPSGSCCAMVREQFEYLLKDDHAYEHGLHHVTARTYEFVEFLHKVLKVDFSVGNVAFLSDLEADSGAGEIPLSLQPAAMSYKFGRVFQVRSRPPLGADVVPACGPGGGFNDFRHGSHSSARRTSRSRGAPAPASARRAAGGPRSAGSR